MSVIYILLPAAMVLAAFFVLAFVRAVRRGQYDDLDTPPVRMLHDDDPVRSDPLRRASTPPRPPRAP